jgi:hypothetical protein
MRREADDAVDELEAATEKMNTEMRAARGELARLRTLDAIIEAERDGATLR